MENAQQLRRKAEKIVQKYKLYHFGMATCAGALGGRFGFDRIPLTLLSCNMIKKICDIYGIKDPVPVALHIASAVIRLTYEGTAVGIALNWLPGGSIVNGGVTYVLTGRAGHECIQDIENNRMNSIQQLILAFGRSAVIFACEGLEMISDKLGLETAKTLRELLNTEIPMDTVQATVSHSVHGLASSVLSGNGIPGIKEFLLHNIPVEIATTKFVDLLKDRNLCVEGRDILVHRLRSMRTNKPVFHEFDEMIDKRIDRIERTLDVEELKSIASLLDQEFAFLREARRSRYAIA